MIAKIIGQDSPEGRIHVREVGEIFTLGEVAVYLKVGKHSISRLVAEKKIPAFKVGGAWRFPRADIEQWIRERARRS